MRLPPPDRASLDPATNELLDLVTDPNGDTIETIAVLSHVPGLVEPFLTWAMALHSRGVLSGRVHEIIALRVAHNCGSIYEWDEHVEWAHRAGMSDADIAAVAHGADGWPDPEATVIVAVDELHTNQDLSDATLERLRNHLGEPAVVELIMVAGQYTMLSMLATTTGPTERRRPSAASGQ